MTASPLTDVGRRILANVDRDRGDAVDELLQVPVAHFHDPERFARELEIVFRRNPLLVALSCDIPNPGDLTTLTIADRPIIVVRGDDGVARTFLNVCRHRGAALTTECFGHGRRLTCPYHAWSYDTRGALVGIPGRDDFAGIEVSGLVEYPTAERCGAVFATLTAGATIDLDAWLGDMAGCLDMLQLDRLHRYDVDTTLPSGNWKATADGFLDGYHLGYLHRNSIGAKSITNRNAFDLYGPHVRLGFANKPILDQRDTPVEQWDMYAAFSLVHFVFPNVEFSGHPGHSIMLSQILPGPTVSECTVLQRQYFQEPLDTAEARAAAEAKRLRYRDVTNDEDFVTVRGLTAGMRAIPDDVVRYGRNEIGSHNLHRWIDRLLGEAADPHAPLSG